MEGQPAKQMRDQPRKSLVRELTPPLKKGDVVERFRSLSVWSKAGQRAPHKPLLCLLAISKLFTENQRLIPFAKIEKPLRNLLREFGPPRKVCHPEYPFWALQNEQNIWEVSSALPILKPANGLPTCAALLASKARGGFQENVYNELRRDEDSRARVIFELLEAHFPETLHEDILLTLGLSIPIGVPRSNDRDPGFRENVLSAYEYRCAVCGFNVRIGHTVVALEAAHIKWHQAAGPDIRENGLALCSLHHKLFDRGAFTIDEARCALISEKAYGTEGFVEHLGRFHKKPLLKPNRECYRPRPDFTNWHTEQVFLGPARE
jgi:putative restriction endonuclease